VQDDLGVLEVSPEQKRGHLPTLVLHQDDVPLQQQVLVDVALQDLHDRDQLFVHEIDHEFGVFELLFGEQTLELVGEHFNAQDVGRALLEDQRLQEGQCIALVPVLEEDEDFVLQPHRVPLL